MKKEYIIGLVVLGVALAYYFLVYKKKDTSGLGSTTVGDQFDIDDTAAYKACRALFSASDLYWVDKEVAAVFAQKRPVDMINGRMSKTLCFVNLTGQMNNNPNGKYVDKDGDKVIWPQETFDKMWSQYREPLEAKYGGLK